MKLFRCQACEQIRQFKIVRGKRSGHVQGCLPEIFELSALEPAGNAKPIPALSAPMPLPTRGRILREAGVLPAHRLHAGAGRRPRAAGCVSGRHQGAADGDRLQDLYEKVMKWDLIDAWRSMTMR
jgi:hypothetical protein